MKIRVCSQETEKKSINTVKDNSMNLTNHSKRFLFRKCLRALKPLKNHKHRFIFFFFWSKVPRGKREKVNLFEQIKIGYVILLLLLQYNHKQNTFINNVKAIICVFFIFFALSTNLNIFCRNLHLVHVKNKQIKNNKIFIYNFLLYFSFLKTF